MAAAVAQRAVAAAGSVAQAAEFVCGAALERAVAERGWLEGKVQPWQVAAPSAARPAWPAAFAAAAAWAHSDPQPDLRSFARWRCPKAQRQQWQGRGQREVQVYGARMYPFRRPTRESFDYRWTKQMRQSCAVQPLCAKQIKLRAIGPIQTAFIRSSATERFFLCTRKSAPAEQSVSIQPPSAGAD